MTARISNIIEKFPELLRLVRGDTQVEVSRPRPPSAPEAGCILFLNQSRLIPDAVKSPASVLVVADADAGDAALEDASQTILQSPGPELALALVARAFFPVTVHEQRAGVRRRPNSSLGRHIRVRQYRRGRHRRPERRHRIGCPYRRGMHHRRQHHRRSTGRDR